MSADVTIIVATYDRPDWLAVSLGSIRTSAAFARLRGIEARILVVDDGSPGEATREVAEALRVEYVRNPLNDGRANPVAARMLGLATVDSPYYAFFDDDDVMLPRWVRLHVEAMERGIDVCSSAYVWTDADLVPTRTHIPDVATMGDLLAGRVSVNTHSLVRTAAAREAPWDPDLENEYEYQVWLDLMFRGRRFDRLTEPTYLHRQHASNISQLTERDPRDAELRRLVIERYRARVLERDGAIPAPTPRPERPRPAPLPRPSLARRAARRLRRWASAGR